MSRILLCALFLGALSFGAVADEPATTHATASVQGKQAPTGVQDMNQRFEDTAHEYAGRDVPRVAFSDIAYPADPAEFKAMDGFGVIWIAVSSQQKDELPLKRVYAVVDGKQVDLQLATGAFAKDNGSVLTQKTLGPYRWDGLYYYPAYLSAEAQQLVIDFAKDRSGFVMLDMQKDPEQLPDYLKAPITHPKGSKPPAGAAFTLVTREYPGYFGMPAPR
ncbi:MAG: hypothetical protein ACHQAU_01540 [Gammaproteobacteria bacterium]